MEEYYTKRDKILNDETLETEQKGILLRKLHKMYYGARDIRNNKEDLELLKEYKSIGM